MDATVSTIESGVVFRNNRGAEIRGALARLTRNALMFEVYSPYPLVETGETLESVRIVRGGQPVYNGGAVVDSVLSTGWNSMVVATPLGSWPNRESPFPRGSLSMEADELMKQWETSHVLAPEYQIAVSSIRSFLSQFARWMAQLDLAGGKSSAAEDVYAAVVPRLRNLFGALEEATGRLPVEARSAHRQYVQRELHPLMLCAPFVHRAYTKPMGYAGDYETVNMILRNRMEGPTAYAAILHQFILSADTGEGHRNRIVRLVDHLGREAARAAAEGRSLRVLNIGCGPADEICRFIRNEAIADRCEFTLVDFNKETIDYASARIAEASDESGRKPAITFVHRSVNDLIKEAARGKSGDMPRYDLVYCAGLFDYLSDRICQKLLVLLSEWTLPGGMTVATNVHSGHQSHAMMEDVLDWHLILRNESQMQALAPRQAGTVEACTEPSGVNIFLEMRKCG
jgi:extracellular factor (EF) 3-hydroxypalmitic acid methyl ester biosynthesis protein